MERDYEKPTVKLAEENGNAFAIIGQVSRALTMAGASRGTVQQYMDEAMSGDYDHLRQVTLRYVDAE